MENFLNSETTVIFKGASIPVKSIALEDGLYVVYSDDKKFLSFIGSRGFTWDLSNEDRKEFIMWTSSHLPLEELTEFIECLISNRVVPQ